MFTLPDLPYAYNALEPYIDELTMHVHHDKHHAGYVKNLNAALAGHDHWLAMDVWEILKKLDQVPKEIQTKVRNNAGGHANHQLFWQIMGPKAGGKPTGTIATAIDAAFGDFETFQEKFSAAAMGRFGSGWAWLVKDGGSLAILDTANQDNPISVGKKPFLALDVWEHAYYLKYQNMRADYIKAWWNVVNWSEVEKWFTGEMKPDDFFVRPPTKPKNVIVFAGKKFAHTKDECFIIADGYPGLPHASEAEVLARDTALWAYNTVRQRPFYWGEKLKFLKRIFRSTNLTLWQKRHDQGFEAGIGSALMVLMVIEDYFWLGSSGNCNSFLFRDGLIDILTKRDVDEDGMLTRAAGFSRKQLIPAKHSEKLLEGDIILLATDSVANFISEDDMRGILEGTGMTNESLQVAVDKLIEIAESSGSTDSMSLCMVKRIVVR